MELFYIFSAIELILGLFEILAKNVCKNFRVGICILIELWKFHEIDLQIICIILLKCTVKFLIQNIFQFFFVTKNFSTKEYCGTVHNIIFHYKIQQHA